MFDRIKEALFPKPRGPSGGIPDAPDPRDFIRSTKPFAPPAVFSLRDQGIQRAWDQGQIGACTGFSASAFVSSLYGRFEAGAQWSTSPLFIYFMSRRFFGTETVDSGAPLRDTLKVLHQIGAPPFSAHPYLSDWRKAPSQEALSAAGLCKIKDYQRILVDAEAPLRMMQTLHQENLPLLIGVRLYESANTATVRFTGAIPIPKADEESTGSHALMIDGYDLDKRLFYGWNSWGRSWGSGGRFSLPFAYFTNDRLAHDIWTVTYRYW